MTNKPIRKKTNIRKEDLEIQKPLEYFISEEGFTVNRLSKDKKSLYGKPALDDYLLGDEETKGEFKQPNIIGKPFRTIIRGKTTSD